VARPASVFTHPGTSAASPDFAIDALARKACDDAAQLNEVLQAHACIEKLIAPERTSELEEMATSRSELGALLRLANAELQRCISAVESSTSQLHDALITEETPEKPA